MLLLKPIPPIPPTKAALKHFSSGLTDIDSHSHSALQNAQDLFGTARIAREDIIRAMEHININDDAIHQL